MKAFITKVIALPTRMHALRRMDRTCMKEIYRYPLRLCRSLDIIPKSKLLRLLQMLWKSQKIQKIQKMFNLLQKIALHCTLLEYLLVFLQLLECLLVFLQLLEYLLVLLRLPEYLLLPELPTIIKPKVETYIPTEEDRAQMKKESEEEEETITVMGEQATE